MQPNRTTYIAHIKYYVIFQGNREDAQWDFLAIQKQDERPRGQWETNEDRMEGGGG